jgi:hypothetical protein
LVVSGQNVSNWPAKSAHPQQQQRRRRQRRQLQRQTRRPFPHATTNVPGTQQHKVPTNETGQHVHPPDHVTQPIPVPSPHFHRHTTGHLQQRAARTAHVFHRQCSEGSCRSGSSQHNAIKKQTVSGQSNRPAVCCRRKEGDNKDNKDTTDTRRERQRRGAGDDEERHDRQERQERTGTGSRPNQGRWQRWQRWQQRQQRQQCRFVEIGQCVAAFQRKAACVDDEHHPPHAGARPPPRRPPRGRPNRTV